MKRQVPVLPSILLIITLMLMADFGYGQNAIENLIVETYYVSDGNDTTDEDGGTLPEGSITYRVFLDLREDVSLGGLFATERHPIIIQSSAPFWNNLDRGEIYGYNISDNQLDENTVALDSWLTLGLATDEHLGVPKELDTDGSFVGGNNNDGGSEEIEGGLLTNNTASMGLPITMSDGLLPIGQQDDLSIISNATNETPLELLFSDMISSETLFYSDSLNIGISLGRGIRGATDENIVLVGQFTTTGDLEFELNVNIRLGASNFVKYVADSADVGEVISPFLSFPPNCGCTDPDFLEYNSAAPCDDGSCLTPIVFGCADTEACNYNPLANFGIPELCCYGIDDCNNLDWTLICPTLESDEFSMSMDFTLYPNPTVDDVWLEVNSVESQSSQVLIYDLQGRLVLRNKLFFKQGEQRLQLKTEALPQGIYLVRLISGSTETSKVLVKN